MMKTLTGKLTMAFAAVILSAAVSAQTFTPGNIVVYRVGNGSTALSSAAFPVFMDEYTSSGTLVQSIAVPTAASGSNVPLVASGSATSEGLITLSPDASQVVLTGYNAAVATASIAGTSVPRVVGTMDGSATVTTSTSLTDFSSGNNPRSAVTIDGSAFWVDGGTGGVRYALANATTSQQLSTTVTNLRQVNIFNGQLYISTSSGTAVRIGTVGTGTPTTSGQTIAALPGVPTSGGSPYSFVLFDLSASVAGPDVLYVADDGPGTIIKYSLVGTTWTSNGAVSATTIRGLTGYVHNGIVTLYGSTNNALYSYTDNSGYGMAPTGAVSSISAAGTNTAFRGIAFAPFTVVSVSNPANQTVTAGAGTATFSVTAAGTLPSYQWYENGVPLTDGGMYAGVTTATLTVTNATAGMSGNTYYCVVSNGTGFFPAGSTVSSGTASLTVSSGCATTFTNNPQTICGGSYTFNGHTYTVSGTYNDTLSSTGGCDSVIVTQLTIHPVYTINNPQTTCGGSYSINGHTYSSSGTYNDTLSTINGCDSIIVTSLTVNPVYTMSNPQQICGGASYTINGHTYTVAGTYHDTLNTAAGCDSIIITQINVVSSYTSNNPQTICGGSYTFNGHTYSASGTYHDTLTSVAGCDSIIITQLTVGSLYATNNPQTVCGSYTFNGHTYTVSGTYNDTLSSVTGCDSVIVTQLTVNPAYSLNNPQTICAGTSYSINGHLYSTAGLYYDTLQTVSGCDSVIITQLSVNPVYTTSNPQSICAGGAYHFNGHNYITAGTYHDTLSSVSGCDSIIVTQLTVNNLPPVTANATTLNLCLGDTDTLMAGGANTYAWSANAGSVTSSSVTVTPSSMSTYTVTGTDLNGCVNTATVTVLVQTCSSSIAQLNGPGKQILLMPNPTAGVFTLQAETTLGVIEVYNNLGQLLIRQTADTNHAELNLDEQHAGIYYVKVLGQFLKVVKQ